MTITTSANPITAQAQSTIPGLGLFQLGADGADAASTANLFRGEVAFPLTLLSLENRCGLKTEVALQYSSGGVAQTVSTVNQVAPTSMVGLGWSLPYEMILLDTQGSGSPNDDTYYFATSDGARSKLWPTGKSNVGTPDEIRMFELESYRFQTITYAPFKQLWTLVEADGSQRIYGAHVAAGDSPAALRTAIKWGGATGNWTGASARTGGQFQFVISWNLARVTNTWGDAIVYSYSSFSDDAVQVGGVGGLYSTRASYLVSITDPTGRVLTFNYLPRRYDLVPDSQGVMIREYEPPHSLEASGPWPFQDRYETRYLDHITVAQIVSGRSVLLMTLSFAYSLDLLADTTTVPGDLAYLYKRYLRGVTVVNANGKLMPGPKFSYYTGLEGLPGPVNRGALKQVTQASGGTLDYAYEQLALPGTALDQTITSSDPKWVPGALRFFPGPDCIVLVGYDQASSSQLSVNVYEWNGQWLSSQPVQSALPFVADLATLQVSFGEDFFVVSVTGSNANGAVQAWAVHRIYGAYGTWSSTELALPTLGAADSYTVAAGNNYVVAALAGQCTICRWTWDTRSRQWLQSNLYIATSSAGEWVLTAGYDYFALGQYQPGQPLYLSLYYFDVSTATWDANAVQLDAIQTYVWQPDYPKLSLTLSQTMAVATLITALDITAGTFSYSSNTYSWDANFNVSGAPQTITGTDITLDTMVPWLSAVATPTMVGNASELIRFDGVDWVQTSMGNFDAGSDIAHFVYAGDLAAAANSQQTIISAFNSSQGQFTTLAPSVGGQGPVAPTANGNIVTVRNTIFQQQEDGSLANLGPMLGDAVVVANQAPTYLVYAQQDGTSYVLLVKNYVVGPTPISINTGSAFVQPGATPSAPGLWLVGPQAFVTFVGASLDSATQFTLHRVIDQQVGGAIKAFVLTSVVANDGLGGTQPVAFDYSQATATAGPYGLSCQFDKVITAAGTNTPAQTPSGTSTQYFYNGQDPAQSTSGVLYSILNGNLWKTEQRNSAGQLVASSARQYDTIRTVLVAATGAMLPLIGGYSRISSTTETVYDVDPMGATAQPPLTITSTLTYNEANGQPRTQQTQNYDAATGALQLIEEDFVYAYEQYPALAASTLNVLTPSVQNTSRVDGAITGIEAVTWTTFNNQSAWAPYRTYHALAATATLSASDWANTAVPSSSLWRLSNQVTTRDASGEVQEMIDADGLVRSVVLDAAARFVVASFENGSLAGQQVAWQGFESYENLTGWTLAGSATTLGAAIASGDASSGSRALVMAGATVPQSSPLANTRNVLETLGQNYLLSCWIKTGSGFGAAAGSASLQISSGSTTLASVAVPDTAGEWQLLAVLAALPAQTSAQPITLSLSNSRTVGLLVDDIRFAPVLSAVATIVYDPVTLLQTATMDSSGQIRHSVLGDFAETSAVVYPSNAPVEIKISYLSRRGNLGSFAAQDPNSIVTFAPRDYAFYQSFNTGNVIGSSWLTAMPAGWSLAAGRLNQVGQTAASISFNGYPDSNASTFGLALRATPAQALTGPVGVHVGALTLSWSPLTAAWTLADNSGTLYTAPVRTLLQVPTGTYLSTLDAASLPSDFLTLFPLAGLPLAAGSGVNVLAAGSSFYLTDATTSAVYQLVVTPTNPDQISVSVLPRDWAVLVAGQNIAFYADGGLVLSQPFSIQVTPGCTLFASNPIGFDNTVFFTQPGVQIQYVDALARPQQEQIYDGATLRARATLYDALGHTAIATQYAGLAAGPGLWGGYIANLATFDWSNQVMSGLVVDENPESGGYPYWRNLYEDSPLGRYVETGRPGIAYAIVPGATAQHTTRYQYGLNDATFTLAPGKFRRITVINPDGDTDIKVSDLLDQVVATSKLATQAPAAPVWNTTYVQFDAAGNLVHTLTPMGWSDQFTYNFSGDEISAVRASDGTTLSVYDTLGRLRFQLDPCGVAATTPYMRYWQYDVLSRVTAEGCYTITSATVQGWPQSVADFVDEASYPPSAQPTSRYSYDLTPSTASSLVLTALGRLTAVISASEVTSPSVAADPFSATETVAYDTRGAIRQHVLQLANRSHTTTYAYDNLVSLVLVDYPTGLQVGYQTDLLGQITTVLQNQKPCATYTYTAQAEVASQANYDDAGNLVGAVREASYNAAGWQSDDVGTGFSEMTEYALSHAGEPSYYGGSPTLTVTAPRSNRSEVRALYGLDPQGRLSSVDYGTSPLLFSYDTNGNTLQAGTAQLSYTPDTCDRVQTCTNTSGTATYGYNPAGALISRTHSSQPQQNLALTWDGFRERPLSVTVGAPSASQINLALRYGYQGRRLQKTVTPTTGSTVVKQYFRGAGEDVLVESSSDGTVVEWIRGPQGLVQFRRNGVPYFVTTDRIGSVRAVVDGAANLIGGYDYTPYGQLNGAPLGSAPTLIAYLFAGRELDESSLYDFRARAYDPQLGRFISSDPRHQFVSPYLYAGNEPLIMVDPNGELAFLLALGIAALIGAVIGAAAGGISYAVSHEGDFKWNDFGKAAGIGLATGALAGAVGFGAGAAAGAGAVALGYAANSVAVGVIGGAIGGAAGGAAGQLVANAVEGRNLGGGMLTAVLLGAAIGGLTGGLAARLGSGGSGAGSSGRGPRSSSPPRGRRFRYLRNSHGRRIWLSRYTTRGSDLFRLVRSAGMRNRRVTILSGTHGSDLGGLTRARRFYDEDAFNFRHDRTVRVYDIWALTDRQVRNIVQSDDEVIAAFCFSRQNRLIRWALR